MLLSTRPGETKIWERLYVGSLNDAEQLARSNPQRIATVVSLCQEQSVQRAPKIVYIHIPIADARPISPQKFEDIMFAIAIGLRQGTVLVHCLQGMNRSPDPGCCVDGSLRICRN